MPFSSALDTSNRSRNGPGTAGHRPCWGHDMAHEPEIGATQPEWRDVSVQAEKTMSFSSVAGLLANGLGIVIAMWVADTVASGVWRYVTAALVFMALMAPMIYVMWRGIR